jgi:hypothetical protein
MTKKRIAASDLETLEAATAVIRPHQAAGLDSSFVENVNHELVDIYEHLMTAVDLTVMLDKERRRIGRLDAASRKIEPDRARAIRALLGTLHREFRGLSKWTVSLARWMDENLVEHGVNPVIPRTWAGSSPR